MPTKPALLTTWASGSPSNRVATGAAKEALGWLPGEKPPAEWFNYWMHNVYSWVGYLNTLRATDVPATYGGNANSNVQAALDGLGSSLTSAVSTLTTRINALPLPGSIGLTAVTPPSVNNSTPDLWSGASGGICVPTGTYGGVTYSHQFPEGAANDGGSGMVPSTWAASAGIGAGLTYNNLRIVAPITVSGQRSPFVLRVHGNLYLQSTLSFFADATARPAYSTLKSNATTGPFRHIALTAYGGAGTMANGGTAGVDSVSRIWGALADDTYQTLASGAKTGMSTAALLDLLVTLPGLGAVGAMAPWVQGGGMSGGPGNPNTAGAYNAGGGFAIVYVSGDIVVSAGGGIRCNGAPGSSLFGTASLSTGGGGGGGGALIVICGGHLRGDTAGASLPVGAFQASGGAGGNGTNFGGGGGGGGFVYVCSRDTKPLWPFTLELVAQPGVGGRGPTASTNGTDGGAGRPVVFCGVPRLMA